ncbi:MAG: PKD domain-containing protein, partial [Flavobacteriales bacterium]
STGSYYYWAIISFDGNDCQDAISDSAQIVIIPDPIVTSPCNIPDTVCQTSTGAPSAFLPLTTIATGGIGTYNYQWWVNDGSGFVMATGPDATTASYTPPSNVVGTFDYFCVVSQNPTSADCWIHTDTCTLVVNPAPIVNTPPQNDSLCVDGIIPDLYVIPTGPGIITYEWFRVETLGDVSVATTATYSPPTNVDGVFEYYCVVSFSSGGCSTVTSSTITIVIMPDPTIDTQPLATDTICEGGTIATPLTVSYTAGTGVGNITYQWYDATGVIPGADADSYTPITSGLSTGSYYYWAIISFDGNDCQDAVSNSAQIEIIGDPIADFELWSGLDSDTLCVNHTQNPVWINQSSGVNINSYTWEIINNNTGSTQYGPNTVPSFSAPTFPYLPAGTQTDGYVEYDLILSVENACSTPTDTHSLVITPLPDPEFSLLLGSWVTNVVCLGSPITVSVGNSTINPPFSANPLYNDSIKIDMGDGTIYNFADNCGIGGVNLACFPSINHLYGSVGMYPVCVTAYNECDSITTCDSIEVINTNIVSSVHVDTPYACVNELVWFTDNSSYTAPNQTEIHWWWDVDPSIITTYLLPSGVGPTADQVVLQDTVSPGYQISHSYSTPGVKFVLQQMATGPIPPCMYEYAFTIVDSIIIYPEPYAHFLSDDSLCLNTTESLIFDSEIPIVTGIPVGEQMITNVIWEVEDPAGSIELFTLANGGIVNLTDNLDIIFDEIGTWTIKITIETNKGCSKQWEKDIFILDLPQPAFSVVPDSTCAGGGNTLYNAWPTTHSPPGPSIETTLPIEYWNWNFDDPGSIGNNLAGEVVGDAIHNYTNSGYYNVTLTVIDNFGCEGQIIDTVFISTPIKARAITDTVCFGTPTTLDGTISTLGTTDWFWDLDMNGTDDATGAVIDFIFPSPGLHTIKLTTESSSIADSVICSDDTVMTVWVRALPQVIFETDTICYSSNYPQNTSFTNNSIEGDTIINNWQWSFGDNQFSTDSNTTHLYDTCGVYEVILTATDEYLCQNKDTANILVVCPPVAGITIDTVCIEESTLLESTSIPGTFPIVNYQWYNASLGNYFPIPNLANIDYATYVFNNIGAQDSSQLIVTDPLGCSDTVVAYAYVRTNPIANFITIDSNFCAGTAFQFFNATTIPPSASMDSIHWQFQTGITLINGTDTTTTIEDPIVTFNSPGDYYIELYFEDDKGCYHDTIKWIEIDSLPYVNFVVDEICSLDTAYFWNYSEATTNPLNTNSPWLWDFGYNVNSSDSNTSYDFNALFQAHPDSIYEGVYQSVKLTVLDSKGCENTFSDIVKLHPLPEVDFYHDKNI